MVIGWDIGGVNTKVARVANGAVRAVHGRAFELQRAPDTLVRVLRELAGEVNAQPDDTHAVTMTAELSQMFRTKREGVSFVLDALEAAFPCAAVHVFTTRGAFVTTSAARRDPRAVAAANWVATARIVARHHPDALLIDIGTTTTDLIPIMNGAVVAVGYTDPERLASGELVYTGAVRTPIEAIAASVPFRGAEAGISAEGFALSGDVHVWRGDLEPGDYSSPTPDGRPVTRELTGERLARAVCADRELIDEAGITAIADSLAAAQAARVTEAMRRVLARHPALGTAVVTGVGAFLGDRAARAAGLDVVPLSHELGESAARCAPAACVALLLCREVAGPAAQEVAVGPAEALRRVAQEAGHVARPIVVKIGGSLLAEPAQFDAALAAVAEMALQQPVLIVPGGGPFADAVRDVDARFGLSDEAAHWMAILGMDQFAHVIAWRLPGATTVRGPADIAAAIANAMPAVLAPSAWLREADPLPHRWDVTSDSIAAWVAGQVSARHLIVIKPSGVRGEGAVDPYFATACPAGLPVSILSVDELAADLSRR